VTYAPHPDYARNSTGNIILVEPTSLGQYQVHLFGIDSAGKGATHVTAHGNDDKRCSIVSGASSFSDQTTVSVACMSPNGVLANSRFILTHTVRSGTLANYYYAHMVNEDSAVGAERTLTGPRNYNSTGNPIKVLHAAAGKYTVKLAGLTGTTNNGTVQVTHVRQQIATPGTLGTCQHNGTHFLSGGNVNIDVVCLNENGAFADSVFNLTFSDLSAAGGFSGGYVHHHNLTDNITYTPTSVKRRIQIGGTTLADTIQIQNLQDVRGKAETVFYNSNPSLNGIGSVPLVTAFGSAGEYCKVESWGGNALVNVRCRDRLGTVLNTKFNSAYVTDQQ
jgi:hypothetical protein